MRIWCISDTHCQHGGLVVPDCDAIIHAGDEANSRDVTSNLVESCRFFEWYSSLAPKKYFIPGNHSVAMQAGLVPMHVWLDVMALVHNDYFMTNKLLVFGSPYTPAWGESWAYMRKRHRMSDVWDTVPLDTDILVTHGPPKGVLDITHDRDTKALIQVGCSSLRKKVAEIKPRYHIFGHIHDEKGISNAGVFERDGTKFVNCSVCDNRGNLINNGVLIDV